MEDKRGLKAALKQSDCYVKCAIKPYNDGNVDKKYHFPQSITDERTVKVYYRVASLLTTHLLLMKTLF